MNAKKCKQMRRQAERFVEIAEMDTGLLKVVYKAAKRGAKNAARLARINITTN